ncbi:MAG: DUF929 family protein [Thermoplasmata archaeon]
MEEETGDRRAMVDWDRVEELRSKGWDWEKVAADPKVGFHADPSAGDPGPALRALYHRGKAKGRRGSHPAGTPKPEGAKGGARRSWLRILYLILPLVAAWFALAYLVPSPVGLLVPAFPYLALVLAVLAFVFAFALWRTTPGRRWSTVFRGTLIGGVVLGLVLAGLIGLTGSLLFGCPYLPSAASLTPVNGPDSVTGWEQVHVSPWQEGGKPVFFSYGAVWCPYCSASSWAIWKTLASYGAAVPNSAFSMYSSSAAGEPAKSTPEVVLANAQSSGTVAVQVAEYTGGTDGAYPATSSCYQQAYVSAYATGIPFIVINGQYLHVGSLYNAELLSAWAAGANGGDQAVKNSVGNETAAPSGGNPWLVVQNQAWFMMALLVKTTGVSVANLAATYHWSAATQTAVTADINVYLS